MKVEKSRRAELFAIYDELCKLWQRAVRLDENFLVYLMYLSLVELRDQLGGGLPMPEHPAAQEPRQGNGSK